MSLEPTPSELAIRAEMGGDIDTAARILFTALGTAPPLPSPSSSPAASAQDPDASLHHLLTSALPPRMVPLFFAVWAPRLERLDWDAPHKPWMGAAHAKGGGTSARPAQSSSLRASTPPLPTSTASPSGTLLKHRAALLSNLGCLHLRIGKPLLAGLLFREALATLGPLCAPGTPQESQGPRGKQGGKGEGVPPRQGLSAGGVSTSAALGESVTVLGEVGRVAYDLGLQQMRCGEDRAAIQSLLAAVAGVEVIRGSPHSKAAGAGNSEQAARPGGPAQGEVDGLRHDPRVWLRLAECYCSEHRRLLRAATGAQQAAQGHLPASVSARLPGASSAHHGLTFNLVALKSPPGGGVAKPKGPAEASHSGGATSAGLRVHPGDSRASPSGGEGIESREQDPEGGHSGARVGERGELLRGARCCLLNAVLLLEERRSRKGGKGEEGEEGGELEEALWVLQCHVELHSDNLLRCIAAGTKALALGARNLTAHSSVVKNVGPKRPSTSAHPISATGTGLAESGESGYSDRCLSRRVVVSLYMAEALSLLRRPIEAQEVLRGVVGSWLPQEVPATNIAALQNMITSSHP